MRVTELLTSAQVAERLGVTQTLLRTWRHRSKGPAWIRMGTAVFYRESEVLKWLQRQVEEAESA